jgi:DNA primase
MSSTDTAQHLQQQITDGIAALARDRQWVALLELTARTGSRYSLGNLVLIGAQRPQATVVCGYRAWARAGRQVRRGEHGIRILAPIIARRPQPGTEPAPAASPADAGQPSTTASGGTAGQPARRPGKVIGFRPVVVFDISQTDGPPPPGSTAVDGYTPHGLRDALTAQINRLGYQVRIGDCGPAFGVTRRADRTVTILHGQPPAQDALTLAHELGHLACGHLDDGDAGYTHRGTAEVEAESVAYILLAAAGMDTAAASFDYIGTWAHGDTDLLRATADTVIRTSRPLLAALGLTPPDPTDLAADPAEATEGPDLAAAG